TEAHLVERHVLFLRIGIDLAVLRLRDRDLLLDDEPRQRLAIETYAVLEIPPRGKLLLGMRGEPAFALGKELLELVVADVVVLGVVEDRNEHIEVRKKPSERRRRAQRDGEVGARPPIRKAFVE